MLTKPLLAIILAACGINSSPATADPPGEIQPPPIEDGQHFCCEKFTSDGGNGCVTIGPSHIALCDKVLYCGGSYQYEKDGGKVRCID
jgi:hypothetical protein